MSDQSDCPAFPVSTLIGGHQDSERTWQFPGLTKRELFAAMAMQGMLAGAWTNDDMSDYDDDQQAFREHQALVARACAGYADALILALNGGAHE